MKSVSLTNIKQNRFINLIVLVIRQFSAVVINISLKHYIIKNIKKIFIYVYCFTYIL